jgi:hypothetical protein
MQERGSIVGTRKGMAVDISGMLHGLCFIRLRSSHVTISAFVFLCVGLGRKRRKGIA